MGCGLTTLLYFLLSTVFSPQLSLAEEMGQGQSQSGEKSGSNCVPQKSQKSRRKRKGKSKSSQNMSSQLPPTTVPSNSTPFTVNFGEISNNDSTTLNHTHHAVTSEVSPVSVEDYREMFTYQYNTTVDTLSGVAGKGNYPSTSVPSRQLSVTKQVTSTQSRHAKIEKYFNKYKDNSEDSILAEGMEKFCIDLGVNPTEFIVLVLAWKFEASQMCRFTREEFMNGCQKMQAHSSKSLKERFPDLLGETMENKSFKDLYNFTFSFGLDHSSGQRSLPIDMAMPLWDLVFTQSRPEVLDHWFQFLQESEVRGISRDTWNMFLPFVEQVHPDLSNYDESEAWPSLFDDFVESEIEKTTQ